MFNNVAAVYPCRVKRNQMRQLHLEMGGWVGEKKRRRNALQMS